MISYNMIFKSADSEVLLTQKVLQHPIRHVIPILNANHITFLYKITKYNISIKKIYKKNIHN